MITVICSIILLGLAQRAGFKSQFSGPKETSVSIHALRLVLANLKTITFKNNFVRRLTEI